MRFASWHVRTLSTEILRSLTESGQIETDAPRGVGAEIEQELLDHLAQEEALGPEDVSELASKRFDALLDGLVALLGECESVEIFGDDSELRRTIASVFPAVLGGGLPSADRGAADGAHEELGRLRSVGVEPPSVVLDDGTRVTVSYEILDACRAHHGDRVRVRRSYGEVTSLAPLLAVAAAVATLSRFAVVDLDAGDLDPESPWPVTLFETAWNHRGDDGVVALDHDEFTVETVSDWLRRSGVDDPKITPGPPDRFDHGSTLVIDVGNGPRPPLRPVPHELGPEINRILGERNSPWRWYELHSFDSRSVFLRLDREAATTLGVGIFLGPNDA